MQNSFMDDGASSPTTAQKTFDELGALTDVDEHLQFTAKMIQRVDIPDAVRGEIEQRIHHIQKRRNDPRLYLAVIGEFSSGKSTFINALLRDELLKTSVLPTTASATKLRYGHDLEVEAVLQGTRPGTVKTNSRSKQITIPWLPGVKGVETREFIHILTAKDEVAKDVVELTITHPAPFLNNGIVIIDTPGTNATNSLHGAVTSKVVENDADAAIVIVPATMPLAQSLGNFLRDSLRPFLHRCIFVVTRIDQIRQREQSELLQNLRWRLVEQLGIKPPILYTCSAQVVLDDITGEEPVPTHLMVWKERFEQLEKLVINRLTRERPLAISENVLRLLTRLFQQLDGHLRSQWEDHQQRQATIEREIIPNLTSFTAQEQLNCQRILDDAIATTIAKVTQCVDEKREQTISNIRSAIFDAQDWTAFDQVVKTGAEIILRQAQEDLQTQLQQKTQNISQAARLASEQFDRKFSQAYSRLEALGGHIESTNISQGSIQINASGVFASMQSLNEEMDAKLGYSMLGGVAAGAAIGSVIPVVGTIAGGIIGFIASAGIFTSLDKRKEQVWEKLRPNLDSPFDAAKVQAQQALETYGRNTTTALNQRIDKYMGQYQKTVAEILHQQQSELQRLNNLQTTIQADLQEIDRRRQSLSAQKQRLAEL
jgi:GTPase Era involved in 16S rRNA processing/gas vesicle protein